MCFWLVGMPKKIGAQFGYLTPPNFMFTIPLLIFIKAHGYPDKINIGYMMKPRGLWDLDPHRNLYKHTKCNVFMVSKGI